MSISLGSTFESFEEFSKVLRDYCSKTYQKFVIASCKKSAATVNWEAAEKGFLRKSLLPERCVYSYIFYRCVKEGTHTPKSRGIRAKRSLREGCGALLHVIGNRDRGVLQIKKLVTEHNHPIGPDVSYRMGRGKPRKVGDKKEMQSSQGGGRTVGANDLQRMVRSVIPPLDTTRHKGEAGRIGIIGGCQEYTGAPYFAAITALKVGADLSHVFCTKDASPVIKSYSPELIVHPILDQENAVSEFEKWLPRLHALVIGPGLGREPNIMKTVAAMMEKSKAMNIPMVIDADGLFLVTEAPELVTNYKTTILTPNAIEFRRLYEKVMQEESGTWDANSAVTTKLLAQRLGHLTILHKGQEDVISDGDSVILCSTEGSPRRCGGQGDLLSGSTAVFFNWALQQSANSDVDENPFLGPGLLGSYMACRLIRECGRLAFIDNGRSMVASDLIPKIHTAFDDIFS